MKKLLLVIALLLIAAPLTFARPHYGTNTTSAGASGTQTNIQSNYIPSSADTTTGSARGTAAGSAADSTRKTQNNLKNNFNGPNTTGSASTAGSPRRR